MGERLAIDHSTVCSWARRGRIPYAQATLLMEAFPTIPKQDILRFAITPKSVSSSNQVFLTRRGRALIEVFQRHKDNQDE